ncbi:MAG: hemerythrin domain-containing protein [Candidatus Omnitrophica bacterium]|nr:hemerythrin domain-containing protein [Candidatus Omnitrophota bacterium]
MSTQEVSGFYGHDHDELDSFLSQFQKLKRQDFAQAKPFFRKFKFGLQRHILWEEEILFPVFESKTGMSDAGPTAVMRQEHVLIKEALEELHLKVRQNDADSEKEEKVLIDLLESHNLKEENILYPAIDQLTTAEEKKVMFQEMEKVPLERYASCGCHHS